ncbi:hypothetical protein HK104_008941 [Borealophlyctis nickersoniae]|nr:hypothetical protein HK104_008941 [Borealophlyctis nickersoniae]
MKATYLLAIALVPFVVGVTRGAPVETDEIEASMVGIPAHRQHGVDDGVLAKPDDGVLAVKKAPVKNVPIKKAPVKNNPIPVILHTIERPIHGINKPVHNLGPIKKDGVIRKRDTDETTDELDDDEGITTAVNAAKKAPIIHPITKITAPAHGIKKNALPIVANPIHAIKKAPVPVQGIKKNVLPIVANPIHTIKKAPVPVLPIPFNQNNLLKKPAQGFLRPVKKNGIIRKRGGEETEDDDGITAAATAFRGVGTHPLKKGVVGAKHPVKAIPKKAPVKAEIPKKVVVVMPKKVVAPKKALPKKVAPKKVVPKKVVPKQEW